jgi:arylformamidase
MAEILYDISPEVSERTAVFPGDEPFRRKVSLDFSKGDNLVLSSIETTLHIGAHVDAPIHYNPKGEGMAARSLEFYLGSCQVVEVNLPRGARIRPGDVKARIKEPRVLFKTGSYPDPRNWNGDFVSLSAELVDWLVEKGVRLVGIDTPSIDPAEDKELESHQAVFRHGIANLEGITLKDVPEGSYTLIALPLKLKDADGSPVRAVLWRS